MELTSYHQPEEFGKGQKEREDASPYVLPTSQNPFCWNPSWLSNVHATRKDPESEWLARDNRQTNPITIKPETVSHMAEQFSCVPLPSCSPPGRTFPTKSLALSAHVSPRTIRFQVLDKSPLGSPYCNTWRWAQLSFCEGFSVRGLWDLFRSFVVAVVTLIPPQASYLLFRLGLAARGYFLSVHFPLGSGSALCADLKENMTLEAPPGLAWCWRVEDRGHFLMLWLILNSRQGPVSLGLVGDGEKRGFTKSPAPPPAGCWAQGAHMPLPQR